MSGMCARVPPVLDELYLSYVYPIVRSISASKRMLGRVLIQYALANRPRTALRAERPRWAHSPRGRPRALPRCGHPQSDFTHTHLLRLRLVYFRYARMSVLLTYPPPGQVREGSLACAHHRSPPRDAALP